MTIVFSIKRNRSSSALRSSTSGHDFPSFQEPAASFLSSKPKSIFSKLVSSSSPSSTTLGEHRRRSSITSILQSCFRNTDRDTLGRQRNSSNAFENDALFERYRYQTQHQRKRSNRASMFADNHQRTNDKDEEDNDDDDDDDDPPPRVICYQEEEQQRRSILVNRSGHRHTTSLQMPGGSSCLNNNSSLHHHHSSSSAIQHRRSKTATHIRHYSHISYISSSNITAHSGDLTAKEFADIAGIRILPDDQVSHHSDNDQPCCCQEDGKDFNRRDSLAHMLEEEKHDMPPTTSRISSSTTTAHHPVTNSSLYVDEQPGSRFSSSDEYIQTTTANTTTNTTLPPPPAPGTTHKPHIWDNAFWSQPHVGGMDNFFTCTNKSADQEAAVITTPESTDKTLIPPVVQEMRSRNSTVFKKGRFEVHVESL